jgi:hypothetical protein
MYPTLFQMADFFTEFHNNDWSVKDIIMNLEDFKEFYKENKDFIVLSGAPWEPGEIVAYIWGSSIWLSTRVRGSVKLVSDGGVHERELLI